MPESKYSIGGIKNGISILFFTMKEGAANAEYRVTNGFRIPGCINEKYITFRQRKR